eukprot:jgi/Picsp_1/2349/NSC_05812-R1_protein sec13 homolog
MATTFVANFDTGHQDTVHDAQFDYYGKQIATCSSDRTIKVFRIQGNQATHEADLIGHSGPVWEISWSHPKLGNLLASCGYDKSVIIWQRQDPSSGTWHQMYQAKGLHRASVNSLCWAPYELGLLLATASSDGALSVLEYDQSTGNWETKKIDDAHPVGATSVSWCPVTQQQERKRIASGGCDSTVKIWAYDEQSGQWVQEGPALVGHTDWVRSVAWAPAGGLSSPPCLASAGQDGKVVVWKQEHGGSGSWKPSTVHTFGKTVWKASWSNNGGILAVTDADQEVTMWKEVASGAWKQLP